MKLISCGWCGVVLDADRIDPPNMYDDNDCLISANAIWDQGDYVQAITCPCCEGKIRYDNGYFM